MQKINISGISVFALAKHISRVINNEIYIAHRISFSIH